MSTLTLAPTITRSAGLPSPKGSTLLRKCACGGNKQSDDEKKRKSALLQRKGQRPITCLLYTSPSPRDRTRSRMPSSA